MISDQHFDYVVVGGGSSGCIVAARLAEESSCSVLLLEAGEQAYNNPETMDANGFVEAFANDRVMVDRLSEPQKASGERRLYMGSGRGMGGSGSVNGMVYTRGDKLDFAQWPKGWKWNKVVPAFKAVEKRLHIQSREATTFTKTCVEASVAAGFERKDGLNDGQLCGFVGYQTMNFEGDIRRSSYVAYIRNHQLKNLTVITQAQVQRIQFDKQKKATGVVYKIDDVVHVATVNCEVILCAGALETPKLLMLSGVGPLKELNKFSIPVVQEAPAIGENLQDHPNVCLFYRGDKELDCFYPQLYGFHRANSELELPEGQSDTCYVFYSAPASIKQSMMRMLPAIALPPAIFHNRVLRYLLRSLVSTLFFVPGVKEYVSKVYGIVVILGKPKSRGRLTLASNNAADQACIDPAYFEDPADMKTMMEGIDRAKHIAAQAPLKAWGNRGMVTANKREHKTAVENWVKGAVMTTFHYCGTCKMGEDEQSPVDLSLRLKGVSGVRVADASAIPEIPVSAINAPSMMIGYRAADFILAEISGSEVASETEVTSSVARKSTPAAAKGEAQEQPANKNTKTQKTTDVAS